MVVWNQASGGEWRRVYRRSNSMRLLKIAIVFLVLAAASSLSAREKDGVQYGAGLIVNVPFPANVVSQVVQDVVQNGIIRGTKEYNKDEYVDGATPVESTKVFAPWTEGGKVFYKVRLHALDPRNFKDGSDVGTLAVRYVVQPQGDKNSVVHINAVFVEDFRKVSHPSNGSVETAEYKDIHDRLETVESIREQTVEAAGAKNEPAPKPDRNAPIDVKDLPPTAPPDAAPAKESEPSASLTPEQHLQDLRRQTERRVKAPGAPLKSAPFHTASTLQTLNAGAEVLVVITSTYWLGVETHDGQHGWMLRDELEMVP